jgi:hypothetical protein
MPPNNINETKSEEKMNETELEIEFKNNFQILKQLKPDVIYKVLIIGESRIGKFYSLKFLIIIFKIHKI